MGRQIAIVATPSDERLLLQFVESLVPIRVFVHFAERIEQVWIDDWNKRDIVDNSFTVWLTSFPWQPEYKQTGGPRCPKDRAGLWYIGNTGAAPVIEVSRPRPGGVDGGRLYWGRHFSAPDGLAYDEAAFSSIVDRIWSWVRRKGRRISKENPAFSPWYLPDAFSIHQTPSQREEA